jgi:chemotaxis protein histidine kinase CheA
MGTMDKKTKEKLEMLKCTYIKNLPSRVADLESLWQLLQKEWTPENMDTLKRMAHNLRGTAATYGLSEVSHLAEQIEWHVKVLSKMPEAEADKDKIPTLLDEFKRLFY